MTFLIQLYIKDLANNLWLTSGCYDPSNAGFNPNTICQGYFAVLLWCLQDQRSQVHGVSILLDWTNFNVNHQSFVGLNNLIKLLKIMQVNITYKTWLYVRLQYYMTASF